MKNIFDYVVEQESDFQDPIGIHDSYQWSFKDHVKKSLFYKLSLYTTGTNDGQRPFKNIVRPILNLQYRAEDIDVKDITLYIDDSEKNYLSFLVKKYHDEVFVKENDLDTYFDELKESKIDFGLGLTKKVKGVKPDVIPLSSIAFCDQADILSGPIGFRHFYNPQQLRECADKYSWNKDAIEEAIIGAEAKKKEGNQTYKTPGAYIEVMEVHGVLDNEYFDDKEGYEQRIVVLAFIDKNLNEKKGQGLILFNKIEKNPLKAVKRDPINGRACGLGGVEDLFQDQVWTNYDEIRVQQMLDAVSKVINLTDDEAFFGRNKNLNDVDNNEVLLIGENKNVRQLDNFPRNIQLFQQKIAEWETHARTMGAAQEAIMGEAPTSGTPFKSVEFQAAESHSLHDYRKGKFAKFVEEIYRDWIIPTIAQEIVKGKKFLATLDLNEMQYVAEKLAVKVSNDAKKEKIINGEIPVPEEMMMLEQTTKENFMKNNKKFIEILKGEMADLSIRISINVAGKQKNLALITDKLVNIFRQILAAPQVLDDPRMSKLFNQIIESSGLNPVDFYSPPRPQLPMQTPQGAMPQLQPMPKEKQLLSVNV